MPTPEKRMQLIDTMLALPGKLEQLVEGLSDDQLTTAYVSGEWTIAQNIHHLADSHMNAFYRFKRILLEDNPLIVPYDQDEWAITPEADKADISDSLTILYALHQRWAYLMKRLDTPEWARPGRHQQVGDVVLYNVLESYAQHGEDHIRQIKQVLEAMP